MFSGERLRMRREELGYTQAELAHHLEISRASYYNWEQGKTQPNQKNLIKLAHLLAVETEYFEQEYELGLLYRQLYTPNQRRWLAYGRELLQGQLDTEQRVTRYPYHVYEKLSAGTGYGYLEDRSYDTVYYHQALDHDLASWVYGDSMEPTYPNGAVVLIRDTGFDYDGEIYAVDWDGQTYLKRVYREADGLRLVSINSKYQDKFAPYIEEPRIIGKVTNHFIPEEG